MEKGREKIADESIDAALMEAQGFESFPRILKAVFHPEPELSFLSLELDNGQRLLIPREMLEELRDASDEDASEVTIGPQGRSVWWPKLDDGVYLQDFLEHRWGKESWKAAA